MRGFFVMQRSYFPPIVVGVPVALAMGVSLGEGLRLPGSMRDDMALLLIIVVVNVASSVLFSCSKLRMRSASDA